MGAVRIVPWSPDDGELLAALVGDAAMMEHLGGPESADKIADRQRRYVEDESGMYKIVLAATGEGVGSVGFWERSWRDDDVYEVGWMVLPAFQGRGIAVAATALAIDTARARHARRFMHAFPSVDNAASNAICRKLGFTLLEACDFEYPPGHTLRCNDWRLDLLGAAPDRPALVSQGDS